MKLIENRNILLDLLPKGMKIAELGIFKAEFSKIILEKLSPSELFLVDLFPKEMYSGDMNGNNIVLANLDDMYPEIVSQFSSYKNIKIIKSYSSDFLNSLDDGYLDAVYIDADHSYEGVKLDLNLSLKKIKKGGIIMGHDYTPNMFPGVVRAVDEFCKKYNLKIDVLTKDGCPTYLIPLK
jgi:hypothetical protein